MAVKCALAFIKWLSNAHQQLVQLFHDFHLGRSRNMSQGAPVRFLSAGSAWSR